MAGGFRLGDVEDSLHLADTEFPVSKDERQHLEADILGERFELGGE
jgi:hypothetical protein